MKRLISKEKLQFDYPSDVERIVKVMATAGYTINPDIAHSAWQEFSDSMCASWIVLPDNDEEIISEILYRTQVSEIED